MVLNDFLSVLLIAASYIFAAGVGVWFGVRLGAEEMRRYWQYREREAMRR